jgi:dihydrolipoamide dehydrogenase
VTGIGAFVDPFHMEVQGDNGKKVVKFKQAIIAAGSQAVKLPFMPEDPRVVDSTGALELRQLPKRMLVIGGGIIGLEMATVYSTLGAEIDVVEMMDGLMMGADRDLVKVWEKFNAKRFGNVMLKTKTVGAEAKEDGIYVKFEGEKAPAEAQRYDLVLVAVGRSPNGKKIGADKAGVAVTERGFIDVDKQMRTNVPHIFAIGDIVGQPMLAHKAVHEGHVAAEAAHGEKAYFDALQIPSVAYTDPEVAWAGKTEDQCKAEGIKYGKAVFPWAASGRAIANGRDEGFTKLIFDEATHRVIGGGIVGLNAGDLISEVCLASKWARTRKTSARRFTRTRRSANRSAWPPNCTKASARICRRNASDAALTTGLAPVAKTPPSGRTGRRRFVLFCLVRAQRHANAERGHTRESAAENEKGRAVPAFPSS